jgi:hypothetical protein
VTVLEWLAGLPWFLVFIVLLAVSLLTFEIASSATKHHDPADRTNDNMGRAALGLLSGALIFTGAFTIITSWNEADQMRSAAQVEVVKAQALVREIELLAPTDTSVAQAVRDYASAVIQNETGKDGTLRASKVANDAFVSLEMTTLDLVEKSQMETYRAEAVADSLKDLKVARGERVGDLASKMTLPLVGLLLVMAFINLVGIGLFPSGTSRGLKQAFGVIVSVAIACILTSVVVLQSVPFVQPRLAAPVANLNSDGNAGN